MKVIMDTYIDDPLNKVCQGMFNQLGFRSVSKTQLERFCIHAYKRAHTQTINPKKKKQTERKYFIFFMRLICLDLQWNEVI